MSKKKLLFLVGGLLLSCVCFGIVAAGGLVAYSTWQLNNMPSLYDEQVDAKQEIALALGQAQSENKYVLLDFGADWCPDCHALAHLFEDDQVKPFIDENYVVVHINVGYWDANLDISERYGDPIAQGIPAVVILDPTEQIVTTTKNGELATARTATKQDILDFLQTWAPEQ